MSNHPGPPGPINGIVDCHHITIIKAMQRNQPFALRIERAREISARATPRSRPWRELPDGKRKK